MVQLKGSIFVVFSWVHKRVFSLMTGIRSEVLLKLQRFSKRRSNIADKENATSELNIQFRSSFSLVLVPRVLNVTKFQGMKNGFEDHPNQKLAHFIFSSNVDLPTKPSAFQFPVIIFLTSNDMIGFGKAQMFFQLHYYYYYIYRS